MKKNRFALLMMSLTLSVAAAAATVDFVPRPVSVQYKEGSFILDKNVRIEGGDAFNVKYLKEHLARVFDPMGDSWNPTQGKTSISFVRVKSFPAEGYSLDVHPESIIITATDKAGEFYAIQTLLQMRSLNLLAR